MESVGIYTPDEDDESTDSELGDLTQQSPVPSAKKSPGFAAKDIDFQDFLRVVELTSSYSLSTAVNTRPANPRFASQAEFDEEREERFLALSTCNALVDLAVRRSEEGLDSPNTNTIGFIPAPGTSKHVVKAYQLANSLLTQSPLTRLTESPPWMANVTPKSRSNVRELDLIHFETMQRESLAIHSYMNAYLTAVTADLKKDDEANPYVLRTLSALAKAVAEIARRSVVSLHQIVLHRRDMGL